jgi:hypothetical protein
MAGVLARHTADRSNVTIEVCAYEEYVPDRPFGLLFSAQAWHWTDPDTRWQRATAALEPGGTLALFWNTDRLDGERAEDEPDLAAEWPYPDLVALPDFTDVSVRLYEWARSLSTVDYLATLSTHSAYRIMDEAEREAQFRALADRLGEAVTLRMVTALYLARRV